VGKKRITALVAAIGAFASWFARGTVESWFFDKVLRLVEPIPTWSWIIEYGPPALFAALAAWLLWSSRDASETPTEDLDFIPMPEATRRAYEALRTAKSVWAGAADRFSGSNLGKTQEEGALLYMATALRTMKVPIYGAHPPSRIRELIDPDEFKRGGFRDYGATFHYHLNKHPEYVDIAVRKKDLAEAIEKMENDPTLAE
jgi:hypothetical protein